MPIDFKMESKCNYLLVTCRGPFTGTGLKEVHQEALERAVEENLRGILVDATNLHGYAPTTMDRFGFGEAIAGMQRNMGTSICIAFVGKEPIVDPGRLGETVALNRGGYAKVFEDMDNATAWISERLSARDDAEGLSRP